MMDASGATARVRVSAVPVLAGTMELLAEGVAPGGTRRNLEALRELTRWHPELTEVERLLVCDAQTSGGLLISVAEEKAKRLLGELASRGVTGSVVGSVLAPDETAVRGGALEGAASRGPRAPLWSCHSSTPMPWSSTALEEDPNECCGILSGQDGRVMKHYRIITRRRAPTGTTWTPRSSCGRSRTPSATTGSSSASITRTRTRRRIRPPPDVRLAENWPDPFYILVSLADKQRSVVRAFRIVKGQVSEEPLTVGLSPNPPKEGVGLAS